MTRPVSYTELAQAVGRHEDSVRRTIHQMIDNGLLVRTSLLQHSEGGSIYRFEEAFPSLLVVQSAPKTRAQAFAPYSLHDSLHPSSSSSSSSFKKSSELLQEVPVDQLILSVPFEELDRRSLVSFARQMPSLGYLQDFIDKVVAVIEHKKQSPKPISDPAAFLFGCLKKMEINPPPGWKSRAVRMMEEEERRLKDEAEELRAVGNRVERHRCELYFLRLAPEKQAEIMRETEAVGERDSSMIQQAKREQRYLELIRETMRQDSTASSV
jgi:DNA-binding Lrp family transcriptional regulator